MIGATLRVVTGVTVGVLILWALAVLFFRQPTLAVMPYRGVTHAQPERLRRDVEFLTREVRPRGANRTDNLDRAAEYISAQFRLAGGRVHDQVFTARRRQYRNVVADFGPSDVEAPVLVIGAHYDAFTETGDLPGADDNASGTAGLLEIGRLFHAQPPTSAVQLVAFTTEEPPFFGSDEMGSAVHARALAEARRPMRGMICLEMIGYFVPRQPWPSWVLGAIYPHRGDFIAVAGGWTDRALTRFVKRAIAGAGGVPVCSFTGPRDMSDASDHRNYWRDGWSSVMVTDTAYLRNPNYHTMRDTPDTLDYVRMARVVDGVYNAALTNRTGS